VNLMAMLPSLLSGKTDIDELAKSMGLIKRKVSAVELRTALLRLCEDSVRPGVEVIEVTGVIGGKRIRCILVADEPQKKVVAT
jgi:hypothetical protein